MLSLANIRVTTLLKVSQDSTDTKGDTYTTTNDTRVITDVL
jgi:hypothetical protein